MKKITVQKMETPKHEGDWHDAPLRWEVIGPGSELQRFSTKLNADTYAKIRRKAKDFAEASRQYGLIR